MNKFHALLLLVAFSCCVAGVYAERKYPSVYYGEQEEESAAQKKATPPPPPEPTASWTDSLKDAFWWVVGQPGAVVTGIRMITFDWVLYSLLPICLTILICLFTCWIAIIGLHHITNSSSQFYNSKIAGCRKKKPIAAAVSAVLNGNANGGGDHQD